MSEEVRLKVAEAEQHDAGRGGARINEKTMKALNVEEGDIISIKGNRMTGAEAWQVYQEDQVRNIIRIDGLIRKNAGVAINESVTVVKADVEERLPQFRFL